MKQLTALVVTLRRTSAPAIPDADRKAFATLQARLALCGVPLERLADGSFVAAGLFGPVTLRDLAAVEAYARELDE